MRGWARDSENRNSVVTHINVRCRDRGGENKGGGEVRVGETQCRDREEREEGEEGQYK